MFFGVYPGILPKTFQQRKVVVVPMEYARTPVNAKQEIVFQQVR